MVSSGPLRTQALHSRLPAIAACCCSLVAVLPSPPSHALFCQCPLKQNPATLSKRVFHERTEHHTPLSCHSTLQQRSPGKVGASRAITIAIAPPAAIPAQQPWQPHFLFPCCRRRCCRRRPPIPRSLPLAPRLLLCSAGPRLPAPAAAAAAAAAARARLLLLAAVVALDHHNGFRLGPRRRPLVRRRLVRCGLGGSCRRLLRFLCLLLPPQGLGRGHVREGGRGAGVLVLG